MGGSLARPTAALWRLKALPTGILSKAYKNGEKTIPFHRIVYADGRIWVDTRHRSQCLKLYKKEGILIDEKDRVKNFREILLDFN